MDFVISTIILAIIVCLLIYFLQKTDDKNSSIPYATYGSYPIIGHLFPFIYNRKKLMIDCQQRYGQCFKIRLVNQYFIFVISPTDWTNIIRNPLFSFPANDLSTKVFDASSDLFGKYKNSFDR